MIYMNIKRVIGSNLTRCLKFRGLHVNFVKVFISKVICCKPRMQTLFNSYVDRSSTEWENRLLQLQDLHVPILIHIPAWCDNTSTIYHSNCRKSGFYKRNKHREIDIQLLCNKVIDGFILLIYLPTSYRETDIQLVWIYLKGYLYFLHGSTNFN